MKEKASEFNNFLKEYATDEAQKIENIITENPDYKPSDDDNLFDLLIDRENLNQLLENSKETMEKNIEQLEGTIWKAVES